MKYWPFWSNTPQAARSAADGRICSLRESTFYQFGMVFRTEVAKFLDTVVKLGTNFQLTSYQLLRRNDRQGTHDIHGSRFGLHEWFIQGPGSIFRYLLGRCLTNCSSDRCGARSLLGYLAKLQVPAKICSIWFLVRWMYKVCKDKSDKDPLSRSLLMTITCGYIALRHRVAQ